MSFKVVWTTRAVKSHNSVCDFILKKWTMKEVAKFNDMTDATILKIVQTPEMFVVADKNTNLRKGYITKHTSLLYKIKANEIVLLYFWANKRNPKKLKV